MESKLNTTTMVHMNSNAKETPGGDTARYKPFHPISYQKDAVNAKLLIVGVVYEMALNGWKLIVGCDISKNRTDVDALFFERGNSDPSASVFAISFNMSDRVRIIGAGPQLIGQFRQIVASGWRYGIQNERDYYGSMEIKLHGNPWECNGMIVI